MWSFHFELVNQSGSCGKLLSENTCNQEVDLLLRKGLNACFSLIFVIKIYMIEPFTNNQNLFGSQ